MKNYRYVVTIEFSLPILLHHRIDIPVDVIWRHATTVVPVRTRSKNTTFIELQTYGICLVYESLAMRAVGLSPTCFHVAYTPGSPTTSGCACCASA
jgi:hypothetical protein